MEIHEALNNLKTVCADYRGTLADHQTLQQSLRVVEKECAKIDSPDVKKKGVKKEPNGNK